MISNFPSGKTTKEENGNLSKMIRFLEFIISKEKFKSKISVVIISLIPLILIPFIIFCVFLVLVLLLYEIRNI